MGSWITLPRVCFLVAVAGLGGCDRSPDAGVATSSTIASTASTRDADAALAVFIADLTSQRSQAGDGWEDLSFAFEDAAAEAVAQQLAQLRLDIPREQLSAPARIQYAALEYELLLLRDRYRWRTHFYPLNQIVGLHVTVPGRLSGGQAFANSDEIAALRAQIETVPTLFAQLEAQLERQRKVAGGMPASLYPRLLEGARQVVQGVPFDAPDGAGPDNPVWAAIKRRLQDSALDGAVQAQALDQLRDALTGPYREAYERLIAVLERDGSAAGFDAGVWQLPDGDAFYAFLVQQFTTTTLTPEDVHQYGLDEVERIHAEMRTIMQAVDFDGDLSAFFRYMNTAPGFYLEDSDANRQQILARAQALYEAIDARVPEIVYEPLSIAAEVHRIEAYREASAPGAFYQAGTAEEPGRIYLNLHDLATVATWDLEALVYHEGVPGHHLQLTTIHTDPSIPSLRKRNVWWQNSAFVEGWALYAEQLAHDMGLYADPYSNFGRLAAELWRACRLVVDTGLHYKRWSREEAIDYLDRVTPSPHAANIRAVDRYIAVPGQATSFKIGMRRILEGRARAREALGERFDIRAFHRAVLQNGFVPLDVMDASIDHWIATMGAVTE